MKRSLALVGALALAALGSIPAAQAGSQVARFTLTLVDGTSAGTAKLFPGHHGGRLVLRLKGLTPGVHGLHFHTVGTCEGPAFTSAGGHLNPAGHKHGSLNPAGSHLGDLPNITANARGKVSQTIQLAMTHETMVTALFDTDGTALVIHAGPDDYRTDPSGNSGTRIACGVLSIR